MSESAIVASIGETDAVPLMRKRERVLHPYEYAAKRLHLFAELANTSLASDVEMDKDFACRR